MYVLVHKELESSEHGLETKDFSKKQNKKIKMFVV